MMEMQKRQRIETAHRYENFTIFTQISFIDTSVLNRFQKHLDKVRDIIKNAFSALPDQDQEDNRLTVPVELMDFSSDNASNDSNQDHCHPLDRLMCSIVDSM